jgi:hypothetical protein
MNRRTDNDSGEEYEVVWSAPAWSFGLIVLGTVAVMLVIAGALLVQRFPALGKPPVWIGAGVILLILAFACRTFLFAQLQLQIGRDRFRIVESFGKVSEEIPYAAIADIKVVRQASVEEASGSNSGGVGLSSFLKGMREPDKGSRVNERRYLGIRFQDEDLEKLSEEQRARHARIRGTFQGCDWVLGSDLFRRSLATVAQKIHVRWVAYLKRTGGGTSTTVTKTGAAGDGAASNGAASNGAARDVAASNSSANGPPSNGTAPTAADVSARSCRLTASVEA